MLSISPAVRIFVHALPTDMRKSFDGLYAIVQHAFAKDVFQGDYFVFLNRCRDRCKILYWDRDGLVVWAKRLEQGSFQLPGGADPASLTIEVDSTTLAMILGQGHRIKIHSFLGLSPGNWCSKQRVFVCGASCLPRFLV
jgi:hypothetical protein